MKQAKCVLNIAFHHCALWIFLALIPQFVVAQELQSTVPFSLDRFPNLENECLASLENKSLVDLILVRIESGHKCQEQPEAVRMLAAILRGSDMGMGGGWFATAGQKFDWNWIAQQHKIEPDASLSQQDFLDEPLYFERLDRNGDGTLEKDDLDWGPSSRYVREQGIATSMFRTLDKGQDGNVSREELLAFFDKAKGPASELSIDAFRRSLELASRGGGYFPGDAPTPERLIRGFFSSELGSLQEGPRVGATAPDFELTTHDGASTVRLNDFIGKKPVVLIFGNFTCGPFRRTYPEFDEIARRYREKANFFGVYVREAHPDDGWMMESNAQMGVKLKQPKSFDERTAVARTCATELKYSMPLLVDTLDDRVGNLYSGMPARAYVIDVDGKVTYQGGRGPFGFRPGEMEQSLIMTLMK